jgi:hypothetical protein
MTDRRSASLAVLGLLSVVVFAPAATLLAQRPGGQAPAPSTWQARTPWGDPDLQGIWSYATLTPLERPKELGDREFFTDEEIAERNARSRVDQKPPPGSPGTYNQFWFDRGTAGRRTSQIVDPPNGRLPPMTPEGEKRHAYKSLLRRDGYAPGSWLELQTDDRCIMYHGVPPQPSGYNNTYQIFQAPGLVAILDENIHHVRLIPLDGRPHIGRDIPQWNGDSVGRWEGDTLIVETTNYDEKTELRFPAQLDGFHNARAVERFRRVDADTIDYRYTVEAPDLFTRPFTVVLPLVKTEGPLFEYACHEANYSMSGILAGARRADAEAAEGRK